MLSSFLPFAFTCLLITTSSCRNLQKREGGGLSKSRAFEIYNNEAAAVAQPEPVVIVEGEATGAYLGHWSQSNVSGTAREYDSSNPTSLQSPGNQKSLPFDEP